MKYRLLFAICVGPLSILALIEIMLRLFIAPIIWVITGKDVIDFMFNPFFGDLILTITDNI